MKKVLIISSIVVALIIIGAIIFYKTRVPNAFIIEGTDEYYKTKFYKQGEKYYQVYVMKEGAERDMFGEEFFIPLEITKEEYYKMYKIVR